MLTDYRGVIRHAIIRGIVRIVSKLVERMEGLIDKGTYIKGVQFWEGQSEDRSV
jgi:hypothetical protein